MAITLVQSDFERVGLVAKHCNLPKLEIAINEATLFDLKPLLCDLYYDVDDNWESEDEGWTNIIQPLVYDGCNDKKKSHEGIKNVLIRYAYARYIMINNFDDTPNGGVTKTNNWSIPKQMSELKMISDRYRTMAYEQWKEVEAYLCLNREEYGFESKNCKPCGCNGKCGSKTQAKGYGIKGTNITKKVWRVRH